MRSKRTGGVGFGTASRFSELGTSTGGGGIVACGAIGRSSVAGGAGGTQAVGAGAGHGAGQGRTTGAGA